MGTPQCLGFTSSFRCGGVGVLFNRVVTTVKGLGFRVYQFWGQQILCKSCPGSITLEDLGTNQGSCGHILGA